MTVSTLTMSRALSAGPATASQAAYENADDQAYWDTYEAHLDALAEASFSTLEAAVEALRAIIVDAIDCDLFGEACQAQKRVFRAALNVAEFTHSLAH